PYRHARLQRAQPAPQPGARRVGARLSARTLPPERGQPDREGLRREPAGDEGEERGRAAAQSPSGAEGLEPRCVAAWREGGGREEVAADRREQRRAPDRDAVRGPVVSARAPAISSRRGP